jgi:hypothetical protein
MQLRIVFIIALLSLLGVGFVDAGFFDSLKTRFGGGSGTINQLDQWNATNTPSAAITQRTWGKGIKITGLSTGACLTFRFK